MARSIAWLGMWAAGRRILEDRGAVSMLMFVSLTTPSFSFYGKLSSIY